MRTSESRDTSNSVILVPLLNPKFAIEVAAGMCELRVRGTRMLGCHKTSDRLHASQETRYFGAALRSRPTAVEQADPRHPHLLRAALQATPPINIRPRRRGDRIERVPVDSPRRHDFDHCDMCRLKNAAISWNASCVSGAFGLIEYCACESPSKTCSSASTPERRSLRWVRTVKLKNKSRVPEVKIVGGNPCRSP